nr:heme-binding protein [Actinomadura latina]
MGDQELVRGVAEPHRLPVQLQIADDRVAEALASPSRSYVVAAPPAAETFAGGLPVSDGTGRVIGAIGVSGGMVEQGQAVAEACAAACAEVPTEAATASGWP